jgi:hypothetical protein
MTNPAFWPPPRPVAKRPPWRRRQQDCADCGVDCSFATGIGHFYTVHRHIWLSVARDLTVGCASTVCRPGYDDR